MSIPVLFKDIPIVQMMAYAYANDLDLKNVSYIDGRPQTSKQYKSVDEKMESREVIEDAVDDSLMRRWRIGRILNVCQAIDRQAVSDVDYPDFKSMTTTDISSDVKIPLVPSGASSISVSSMFDTMRCNDYIPIMIYTSATVGQIIKVWRDVKSFDESIKKVADLMAKATDDAPTTPHITCFYYVYSKDRPIMIKWSEQSTRVRSVLRKFVITADELIIEKASDVSIGVVRTALDDAFGDAFGGAAPIDWTRTTKSMFRIKHRVLNAPHFNQFVFKSFVAQMCDLGFIQVNDRAIRKVSPLYIKNFRYFLYTDPPPFLRTASTLYVYNTYQGYTIQCAHKNEDGIIWICKLVAKIAKFLASSQQAFNPFESYDVPAAVSQAPPKFTPLDKRVSGYTRECQPAQKRPTFELLTDETVAQSFRRNPWGTYKNATAIFFKTTQNEEYIVYCPNKQYPEIRLIPMRGEYRNDEYPVMPCCGSKEQTNKLVLYNTYMKYVRGEITLASLYDIFAKKKPKPSKPDAPQTRQNLMPMPSPDSMKKSLSLCDQTEYGHITKIKNVYDILKFSFKTQSIYRHGTHPLTASGINTSLISAIHCAITHTYAIQSDITDALTYIKTNIHLCCQEMATSAPALLASNVCDITYLRALQYLYKTYVFVISYDDQNNGTLKYFNYAPDADTTIYEFVNEHKRCVILLENHGTEFSATDMPTYEPLFINQQSVFNDANVIQHMFEIMSSQYNITFVNSPVPPSYTVIDQKCDGYNKVRTIQLRDFDDATFWIHTDPLPAFFYDISKSAGSAGSAAILENQPPVLSYVENVRSFLPCRISEYKNGAIIHMNRPDDPASNLVYTDYNVYCAGDFQNQSMSNHPMLNLGRTRFDDFIIAHQIAKSTKDNLLLSYANKPDKVSDDEFIKSGRFIKLSDNIDTIFNDATNEQFNGTKAPLNLLSIERAANVYKYWIEYFKRSTDISLHKQTKVKPSFYSNINDFKKSKKQDIIGELYSFVN